MSELLAINVNEHTEKKGGLTYLSWAWAWAEVLKYDPQATWIAHTFGAPGGEEPFMRIGDTAMVHTSVTIKGLRRDCLLPVMDNRNNAVKNPDARKISDAIMRCMTKAIAMHGLGLYIYAGEDLPSGTPEPTADGALQETLAASIEAAREARQGELDEYSLEIIEAYKADDHTKAIKLWQDDSAFRSNDERAYCWGNLRAESTLRALLQANSRPKPEVPNVERVSPGPGLKKVGVRA